jgi:hypothetical protein
MSKQFFDHLNQIIKYKKPGYWESLTEEDKKSWNTYMINRYFSMNTDFIEIVDIFQKYNHSLDNKLSYILYNEYIPKSNVFLKYLKKDKSISNKEIIEYIQQYYECSLKEAKDYFKLLSIENIEIILQQFGLENKQIKKLLKELK